MGENQPFFPKMEKRLGEKRLETSPPVFKTCAECTAAKRSWQVGRCNPTARCIVMDAACFDTLALCAEAGKPEVSIGFHNAPPVPEPSSAALAHNCSTKERWSDAKSEWCCTFKKTGCPRTTLPTPEPAYDCSMKERWSDAKSEWCCANKKIDCLKPATSPPVFKTCAECTAAKRSWQVGRCNPTARCIVMDTACFHTLASCAEAGKPEVSIGFHNAPPVPDPSTDPRKPEVALVASVVPAEARTPNLPHSEIR